MNGKFQEGWYVAYTKPKHEKKIKERLLDFEINSFLPTIKSQKMWNKRKKIIDEPLFPSYVFVRLTSKQSYFNSLEVDGLLFYVRLGKEISRVNDEVINNVMVVVDHGAAIEVSSLPFRQGQALIISEGPLKGLSGEMIGYNGKQKILVRVSLLMRAIILDMPVSSLKVM